MKTSNENPKKPTFKYKLELWTPRKSAPVLAKIESKSASDIDTPLQRRYNDAWATKYAQDMRDGTFKPNSQGIAFDEDDNLVDGRHRLSAIVKSGTSHWFITVRGLKRENLLGIDDGYKRSTAASLAIAGVENSTRRLTSVAMRMAIGPLTEHPVITKSNLKAFIDLNREAIDIAVSYGSRKAKGLSAGVLAVLARAVYHEPIQKLDRFAEILVTGEQDGKKEQAAIPLRNWLLSGDIKYGTPGGAEAYRKTQRALRSFCDEQQLKKLFEEPRDIFPLPKNRRGVLVQQASGGSVAALAPNHGLNARVLHAFKNGDVLSTKDVVARLGEVSANGKCTIEQRVISEMIHLRNQGRLVRVTQGRYSLPEA
jgi:hypothetical protein